MGATSAEQLPHLLSEERDHRVQATAAAVSSAVRQHAPERRCLSAPFFGEAGFGHLHVEAAELVPREVVQRAGRVGEAVLVQGVGDLLR